MQAAPTVLVVIPDGELRRSIEFAFDAEGFASEEHGDLRSAIAAAIRPDVVCVVVDENAMAGSDGVKALRGGAGKPFILLVDKLRAAPDTDRVKVLTKPLLGRLLVDTVARAMPHGPTT